MSIPKRFSDLLQPLFVLLSDISGPGTKSILNTALGLFNPTLDLSNRQIIKPGHLDSRNLAFKDVDNYCGYTLSGLPLYRCFVALNCLLCSAL